MGGGVGIAVPRRVSFYPGGDVVVHGCGDLEARREFGESRVFWDAVDVVEAYV